MQWLEFRSKCGECSQQLLDAGDELVCPGCGVVEEKMVVEYAPDRPLKSSEFTSEALGSFLGPYRSGYSERFAKGLSGASSTYSYLKTISDHSNRGDGSLISCSKLIARVSEKLCLPPVAMSQAVALSRRILGPSSKRPKPTVAAVSAYCLIAACRMEGIASASSREIVEAHRSLGKKVKTSSLIRLSLESPVKTPPRRPEDYVGKVLAKLSEIERLKGLVVKGGQEPGSYFQDLRASTLEILASMRPEAKSGHNPCALAATGVYAGEMMLAKRASRDRWITQKDVANCGDTAEYTIREQYRDLFMREVGTSASGEKLSLPLPRSL